MICSVCNITCVKPDENCKSSNNIANFRNGSIFCNACISVLDMMGSENKTKIETKKELINSFKTKKYNVIVCLPQLFVEDNFNIKNNVHYFILDEAHQWYFQKTVNKIIELFYMTWYTSGTLTQTYTQNSNYNTWLGNVRWAYTQAKTLGLE